MAESRLLSAIPDPARIWKQLLVSASRATGAEICAVLLADGGAGALHDPAGDAREFSSCGGAARHDAQIC